MHYRIAFKYLFIVFISSFFILISYPGVGLCKNKPNRKIYFLQNFYSVDFCQSDAPIVTKVFKAYKYTNSGTDIGTLTQTTKREPLVEDYCGVVNEWREQYGGSILLSLDTHYEIDNKKGWVELGFTSGAGVEFAYEDPLLVLPYFPLQIGNVWGGAFILKRSDGGPDSPRVYQFALMGVEDVTVEYGSFNGCLKIGRIRENQSDRVAWICPGVGLVKMIYSDNAIATYVGTPDYIRYVPGYDRKFELQDISYD